MVFTASLAPVCLALPVAGESGWTRHEQAAVLFTPAGEALVEPEPSARQPRTVLVDSRGTRWRVSTRRGPSGPELRILGEGREQATLDVDGDRPPEVAVEDARGRVWFASYEWLRWFDGERWHARRMAGFEEDIPPVWRHARKQTRGVQLVVGPDGGCVYAWRFAMLGLFVCTTDDEEPVLVGPLTEPAVGYVSSVQPLDATRAFVLPGAVVLDAAELQPAPNDRTRTEEQWAEIAADAGLKNEHLPTRLGELLLEEPVALRSADGSAWLTALSATDADGARVPCLEERVLFRIDAEGGPKRAAPELQAFQPDFIDRDGTAWRWRVRRSLERLNPAGISTLAAPSEGEAPRVWTVEGVDAQERVYLRFDGDRHTLFVVEPETSGTAARWTTRAQRVWSPGDEEEALAAVRALVSERRLVEAGKVAHRFAHLHRREGSRTGAPPNRWHWIAQVLPRPGRARPGPPTPLAVASAAGVLGLDRLAIESYDRYLAAGPEPRSNPASAMQNAAHCAFRLGYAERGVTWLELAVAASEERYRARIESFLEAARAYRDRPQGALVRLRFTRNYWEQVAPPMGAARTSYAVAELERLVEELGPGIPRDVRREVYALLSQLERDQPERATYWALRLAREVGFDDWGDGPGSAEPSPLRPAQHTRHGHYLYPGNIDGWTLLRHLALRLQEARHHDEAIAAWSGLLPDLAELRAYIMSPDEERPEEFDPRLRFGHEAVKMLSRCHEGAGRLQPALEWARRLRVLPDVFGWGGLEGLSWATENDARIKDLERRLDG